MSEAGPTKTEQNIAIVMLIIFSVVGSVGNGFVIYVFAVAKQKMTSTVFIITLAIIDLLTCLVTIPFTVAMEIMIFRVSSDVICKMFHFLLTTTVPFSAFVMVAIAIDRYFCICRPFKKVLNKCRAIGIVLGLFVFSLIIGIISCLDFGIFVVTGSGNENPEFWNSTWMAAYTSNQSNFFEYFGNMTISSNGGHDLQILMQVCTTTAELFGPYLPTYQLIYSLFYAVSVVLVITFYILIYRFILTRRHRRLTTEQAPCCSVRETTICDAETTATDFSNVLQTSESSGEDIDKDKNQNAKCQTTLLTKQCKMSTQSTLSTSTRQGRQREERMRLNNIKTALMLSMVAFVFIVAFLPAWLMKHKLIEFNIILFYLYFVYNVANPFIYAFMNPHFQHTIVLLVRRVKAKVKK